MGIKSQKDIEKLMRFEGEIHLPSDGWADVSSLSDNCYIHIEDAIQIRYVLKFGISYLVRDKNIKKKLKESHKKRMAYMLHQEIYGALIDRLVLIRFKMENSPKKECLQLMDDLLVKLTEE